MNAAPRTTPATDATTTSTATLPAAKTTLEQVIQATPGLEPARAEEMLRTLINGAAAGSITFDKNVVRSVNRYISTIDAAISEQLAAVMHAPEFQKLEGSWRGLHHLVSNTETSTTLKIRVMNVTKRDLFKDLDNAVEFDQSLLFRKVYEDEFGMPGGQPFGALIGDYEFGRHPEDVGLLEKLSGVAAAAFCPFVAAASPSLLDLNSFEELSGPRDIAKIFDAPEYIKWRSFRDSPDSRYVALVMPRVLARLPYGSQTLTVDEFDYEEVPQETAGGRALKVPHEHYCWMNAAYVYGTVLTGAFARTNWCTAIRGPLNGGSVEGLPVHLFTSDAGDTQVKCPSEIAITDRRDAELSKVGLIPLCHYKNTDYSVFFGGQTTQRPKVYASPRDTANAAISARLPYIMASSRIAHYLKMIARDKIGSFLERDECEDWLNRWIMQYRLADEKPTAEMKARYPLADAKIEVREIPGNPGAYNATALLRPWLQLEELNTALSIVAEIPRK
jgi:type VI secretion system protein ImpC